MKVVANHTANIADLMGSYQFLWEYKKMYEKLYVFAEMYLFILGTAIYQEALSFFLGYQFFWLLL